MTLRATGTGGQVVVCSTCRHPAQTRADSAGQPAGTMLAKALRRVRETDHRLAGVTIEEMPCLFACAQSCAVHIRESGKIGYVLGGFVPDDAAAAAILGYAAAHGESTHGVVPYDQWPEGVKGHFIVRIPPAGAVVV